MGDKYLPDMLDEGPDEVEGLEDAADFPSYEPPPGFDPDSVEDKDAMLEWWLDAEARWKEAHGG